MSDYSTRYPESARVHPYRRGIRIGKKIICPVVALILAAAAVLSACGSHTGAAAASSAVAEDYAISIADGQKLSRDYTDPSAVPAEPGAHIAVVAKELNLGYWAAVQEGAQQAVDDINDICGYEGDDRIVLTFEGTGDGADVEAQINQIDAVLAENPSALCIAAVDMESCAPQLEAAKDNGIPVLALDSGVENPMLTSTCATDNYAAAVEATEKLCAAIGDAGEIAIVSHTQTTQTATDRTGGFTWEIALHPDIRVAANLVQNAYESTETMLASTLELHPDLRGIFCTNEQMAVEVLEALEKLERTDLVVVGFDAGEAQRTAIADGAEYGLICQNPRGMGYVSIVAALYAAAGERIDRHIDTGYRWIDRGTLDLAENRAFLY